MKQNKELKWNKELISLLEKCDTGVFTYYISKVEFDFSDINKEVFSIGFLKVKQGGLNEN